MIKNLTAKTVDEDSADCQGWISEKKKKTGTKNEKSQDYCKADHNTVHYNNISAN